MIKRLLIKCYTNMSRWTKVIKVLFNIILLILLGYFALQRSCKIVTVKKIDRFLADIKHVLMWTKTAGLEDNGQKHFIEHQCRSINCYFSTNRSLFGDIRYFDAVLFNVQDLIDATFVLPHSRGVSQKYIFVANESADNYPICNPVYDSFFNWTWTYRTDSTVSYKFIAVYNNDNVNLGSHFQWIKNMRPIDKSLKFLLDTKSKAAAIFLDKCKSRSYREVFIKVLEKNLAKYNLTIDVYGNCGPLKCKRKTMSPCFRKLRRKYFFYLAFEDSIAVDYVTDAVLYGLNNNAVPIVYGGAQYDRFLPPNSYLDIDNFTTEGLADRMYHIIQDRNLYYDFFRWKNYYIIKKSLVLDACSLCDKLNIREWLVYRGTYKEFRMWWNPDYKERCVGDRLVLL